MGDEDWRQRFLRPPPLLASIPLGDARAASLLHEIISWRSSRGERRMLGEDPSDHVEQLCLERHQIGWYSRNDRQRRLLTLERLGANDLPGLAEVLGGPDDLVDLHIRYMEVATPVMMEEASQRRGHVVDKRSLLRDLKGTIWHLTSKRA